MSFLKTLFGCWNLDGAKLANSTDAGDYAQIDLLLQFEDGRQLHETVDQQRWSRVLSRELRGDPSGSMKGKAGWNSLGRRISGYPRGSAISDQVSGTVGQAKEKQRCRPCAGHWRIAILV